MKQNKKQNPPPKNSNYFGWFALSSAILKTKERFGYIIHKLCLYDTGCPNKTLTLIAPPLLGLLYKHYANYVYIIFWKVLLTSFLKIKNPIKFGSEINEIHRQRLWQNNTFFTFVHGWFKLGALMLPSGSQLTRLNTNQCHGGDTSFTTFAAPIQTHLKIAGANSLGLCPLYRFGLGSLGSWIINSLNSSH